MTVDDLGITDEQFRRVAALVQRFAGIQLPADKRTLVASRVRRLVRDGGFPSVDAWCDQHLRHPDRDTLSRLVDHMSTNHTFFWRESDHFVDFRDRVLPRLIADKQRAGETDLRLWCAAASTGQEPYQIQMLTRQVLGPRYASWRAGLLATDISEDALARAKEGRYGDDDVQRLPPDLRHTYFRRSGAEWQVVDELKRDLVFRRFNLLTNPYPFKTGFDVVFLRNVMIYFDVPTKTAILRRIGQLLQPAGVLYVGTSESLRGLDVPFVSLATGVYEVAS